MVLQVLGLDDGERVHCERGEPFGLHCLLAYDEAVTPSPGLYLTNF